MPATAGRVGAFLFLAGAGALMGIITAESLYPGDYNTGGSMISDLEGPSRRTASSCSRRRPSSTPP